MDNNVVQKVYDLKVVGGDVAYNQFSKINTLFIEMARNKQSLGTIELNIDASKVNNTTTAFDKLVDSNKELLTEMKVLTVAMKDAGQVGQTMINQLSNAFANLNAKVNLASIDGVVGFTKFQQTISSTGGKVESYMDLVNDLSARYSGLKKQVLENNSAMDAHRQRIESAEAAMEKFGAAILNNASVAEQYNNIISAETGEIARLTTENRELANAMGQVSTAMSTLNKVANPVLTREQSEAVAQAKIEMSEQNIELRQNAKLVQAAQGSIDQLSVRLGILRDKYRALSEAERESAEGLKKLDAIQELDAVVKALDKSIGNNQRNVGNYGLALEDIGSKLEQFVVRDLFRAAAGFVVFTAAFEGSQWVWDEIVNKEQKASEAAEKERQANEKLTQSFNDLAQAVLKFYNEERLLIDANELLGVSGAFDKTIEGAKSAAAAVAALGVANGEVYRAEKSQLEANQATRQREIDLLNDQKLGIENIKDTISKAKKESTTRGFDYNDKAGQLSAIEGVLNNSVIPGDMLAKMKTELETAAKDKADLQKVLTDIEKKYSLDVTNIALQLEAKKREISAAEVQFQSKQNELIYSENLNLNNQLVQLKEQSRELIEKGDIASVDKIVKDTNAKYGILINSVKLLMSELAKQFPDDKLPETLQKKFDSILATLNGQRQQDRNNQEFDLAQAKQTNFQQTDVSLASGASEIAGAHAGYGVPNYDAMAAALDKETELKEKTIREQFENEAKGVVDSSQLIELQIQRDAKIVDADKEMYVKRLQLASAFFKRVTELTREASDNVIEEWDIATTNKITKVLKGPGSDERKNRKIERIQDHKTIDTSNETITAAQSQIPDAKKAVDDAQTQQAIAASEGDQNALTEATKAYNAALKDQLDLELKIAHAERDKAAAQNDLKKDQISFKQMADGMAEIATTISNSYFGLLAKQDEYRQKMAQRSLQWNEKLQESELQSNNQRLAAQRANMMAEQQLESQKAEREKKRAQQQIIINAVIGASKALVEHPGPIGIADAALIMIAAGIQEAFLAQAPTLETGGEVPSNGGMFGGQSHRNGGTPFFFKGGRFEAEAGEVAIINKKSVASNQQMTISGTPKQIASAVNAHGGGVNFAPGAALFKYEYGGDLGSFIQPPSFLASYSLNQGAAGQSIHNLQLDKLHNLVTENTQMIRENNNTIMQHAASVNGRIDKIQVSVNTNDITNSQNKLKKSVKAGNL